MASKSMGQADSLSKRADWAEGIERDNKNQVMLKKKWLEIRVMEKGQLLIEGAKEDIIEKIKKSEAKDNKVIKVMCHKLHSACISTTSRLIFTN